MRHSDNGQICEIRSTLSTLNQYGGRLNGYPLSGWLKLLNDTTKSKLNVSETYYKNRQFF